MPTKHTLRTVHTAVAAREDFVCNRTLSGSSTLGFGGIGILPDQYQHEIIEATKAPDFYVVKSYATPIAWYARGVWTVPPVKYSVSTSRHKSACRLYSLQGA